MTITADELHDSVPITYEVIINYCDKTKFPHAHRANVFAVKEYTDMMTVAVEDHEGKADHLPRHIRSVHMLVFDPDSGLLRSHIDTGVFPCSHTR